MKKQQPFGLTVLLAVAVIAGFGVAQVSVAAGKAATSSAMSGQEVTYADLQHHIGEEIVIQTTLDTRRTGVLKSWTSYSVDMQLGPESGSIELTVPAEDVRSVRVIAPVVPASETEGGSAKKN